MLLTSLPEVVMTSVHFSWIEREGGLSSLYDICHLWRLLYHHGIINVGITDLELSKSDPFPVKEKEKKRNFCAPKILSLILLSLSLTLIVSYFAALSLLSLDALLFHIISLFQN